MKFNFGIILLCQFFLAGNISAENSENSYSLQDSPSRHLIYTEKSLDFKSELFSCSLVLSNNLIQNQSEGWGGGDAATMVARKRFKIINDLESRVLYLTQENDYSNYGNDEFSKKKNNIDSIKAQRKCLFAILMRDYALSEDNHFKFFHAQMFYPVRDVGLYSNNFSRNSETGYQANLLNTIYESKLFSEDIFLTLIEKNVSKEMTNSKSIRGFANMSNIVLQNLLFQRFSVIREAIDKLNFLEAKEIMDELEYNKKLKPENNSLVIDYMMAKFGKLKNKNKPLDVPQKPSVSNESEQVLAGFDNESSWELVENEIKSDNDDKLRSLIFEKDNLEKIFKSKVYPQKRKCSLAKDMAAGMSPFSMREPEFKIIKSLYDLKESCLTKALVYRKLFTPEDVRFKETWCMHPKYSYLCDRFYFNKQWLDQATICTSDNECTVSSVKKLNLSFYHNKSIASSELDLYLRKNRSGENGRTYVLGLPSKCYSNRCSPLPLCSPKKSYDLIYNDYVKQPINSCTSKKNCIAPFGSLKVVFPFSGFEKMIDDMKKMPYQVPFLFFPLTVWEKSMAIYDFSSGVYGQCQNIQPELDELIASLAKKEVDCVDNYCQLIEKK